MEMGWGSKEGKIAKVGAKDFSQEAEEDGAATTAPAPTTGRNNALGSHLSRRKCQSGFCMGAVGIDTVDSEPGKREEPREYSRRMLIRTGGP